MSKINLVSVVVPVYRNEGSLQKTYGLLKDLFVNLLDSKYAYQLIFVDDGSDDRSLSIIKDIQKTDANVIVVALTRNFGQISAMSCGYAYAKGDVVVTISADLQDPVELIGEMIGRIEAGAEIAICYRTAREDDIFSQIFSRIAYRIIKVTTPNIPSGGFDYMAMTSKAMNTLLSFGLKTRFYQNDVLWAGYPVSLIPYTRRKRMHGRSQYTFWKKFKIFLDAVLDASYLPIRLISLVGTIISILGFIYAGVVVFSWLLGNTPFSGWAPIIISVLVVGGLNLLMLGVVGEYVWRIYDAISKKPGYVISEVIEG